ncbi:MAG: dihydroorotate dehydrogenase electron transfer subunit [Tepidisphaeraceae bacterium]
MHSTRRGQFDATVAANQPLCREHFRLTLRVPSFPPTAPGQFVQLQCVDDTELTHEARELDWPPFGASSSDPELEARVAVLRRPFSLAGRRDTRDGVELDVIARTVGIGTDWMSRVQVGDRVSVIGPLGNAFTLPPENGIALLVGGGVGVPPMIYLAEALAKHRRRGIVFCGAMTRDLIALTITNDALPPKPTSIDPLYNVSEFARHNIPAVITTDDGSYGYRGFVTQALEQYLDAYITDNADRQRTVIYTCGPEGMMKHAASIAERRMIACQVCVERAMACGMGTCQSCCIKVRKPDPAQPPLAGSEWCYRLACTDGPVFESTQLLW